MIDKRPLHGGRSTTVAILAALVTSSIVGWPIAAAQTARPVTPAEPAITGHLHDWDFLVGRWTSGTAG